MVQAEQRRAVDANRTYCDIVARLTKWQAAKTDA